MLCLFQLVFVSEVMMGVGSLVLSVLLLQTVFSYPTGAPDRPSTCRNLRPGHIRTKAQAIPPLFTIEVSQEVYSPGETLQGRQCKLRCSAQ